MTGFAFYSCEDVVDNPAKDPAQSWNYSVSVKFADFDFNGAVDENSVPYTYKAPTTLYVLNEENTLMGTITTDAAPAIGDYGTYAGTLTGSIGNNLIITTKIGNDLGKQDGTLKSAIENGIVQTAEVPIKIYNANSGTLTTASAKLENSTAIAHIHTGQLNGGDKVKFTDETKSFEWTVNEDFKVDNNDWWNTTNVYIAVPTNGDPEAEYTISTDGVNGYTLGATFDNTNLPLTPGELSSDLGYFGFEELGIDLTKYDAYYRDNATNKTTGYYTYYHSINDDKSFIITQSGGKLDSMSVYVYGNTDKNVALTIDNINLGEGRSFGINNGAKFDINLIGENKFETLNLNTPFTKKGTGTWKFNQLNVGGSFNSYDTDGSIIVNYAAEYTIDEDLELAYLSANNGGKITIADGKKVKVTNEKGNAVYIYRGTIKTGKGSTLEAESKVKENNAIYLDRGTFEVGENAVVNSQAGKDGYGIYINNTKKTDFKIGKNARVTLIGGPEDVLGTGLQIYARNSDSKTNVTLEEGATLTAVGIDKYGIYCDNDNSATINFNIGKNAKITAEDTNGGYGIYTDTDGGFVNFDGEGTFEAKSAGNYGMALHTWGGAINIKGGNISAIGGADKAAITSNNLFTIAPEIKSFKATKGTNATHYIEYNNDEAKLEDLVADKTKFNDATADGVRTITPKAE